MSTIRWRPPQAGVEVLESLYQHRLLDTSQVRVMHTPGRSRRWVQRLLAELELHELIGAFRGQGAMKVWHLTRHGATAVEEVTTRAETRRRLVTAGQLQQHTLAVNHVGITYLKAARERGDEFGPLSWRHEIAHPIASGTRRQSLVADALITYLITDDTSVRVEQRFLELDRATMPIDRLAEKLGHYVQLHNYTPKPDPGGKATAPAWKTYYHTFPEIQIVLTGAPRPLLERRLRLLLALYHANPALSGQRAVKVSVCLLDDLQDAGPFGQVWLRADDPARLVNWLAQPQPGAAA